MYGLQVKCRGRDLQENFQNMTLKNKSCQIIHVLFTNGTNGVKVYSKLNLSFLNVFLTRIGEIEMTFNTFLKFSPGPLGWLNVEILIDLSCFFLDLIPLLLSLVFLVSGASYEAYFVSVANNYTDY